jgi:hypothetical protein
MRNDSQEQFVRIRKNLNDERGHLEIRLRQINEALGDMPCPLCHRFKVLPARALAAEAARADDVREVVSLCVSMSLQSCVEER